MLQSPSKIVVILIELIFLDINMFLALLRTHFNSRYAQAKIGRAENIFMPANNNLMYKVKRTPGLQGPVVSKAFSLNGG